VLGLGALGINPVPAQQRRIYVGSLHYDLTEEHVRQAFSAFGTITKIDMPKENGRSKGFCFIEFTDPNAAEMALKSMNGFTLAGR